MALLTIDLQDGFDHDTVAIELGCAEVFRRDDVTSSLLLGVAESLFLETGDGLAELRITLPRRSLEQRIAIDVRQYRYVGVSVADGAISAIASAVPFGYA